MSVKIRLQRRGRKKKPFYHIVVADARAPRDGRFIEKVGIYDPMTKPATIDLDQDLAYEWLMKGAQPTETVRAILKFKGVLYKKHLMRGVQKGALTEEQAMAKWTLWMEEKEAKIKKRREETAAEKSNRLAEISGTIPKIVIKEDSAEDDTAGETPKDETAPVETAKGAEEEQKKEVPAEEVSDKAESAKEEQKQEATAKEVKDKKEEASKGEANESVGEEISGEEKPAEKKQDEAKEEAASPSSEAPAPPTAEKSAPKEKSE